MFKTISKVFKKFVYSFKKSKKPAINTNSWLKPISYEEFLILTQ